MRLIYLILITILFISCSKSPSKEDIILSYQEAINTSDINSVMTHYHVSATFNIPELSMNLKGLEQLRGVAEYDSVLNTKLIFSNLRESHDTVYCSITETNNWMAAAGMGSIHFPDAHIIIKDMKISHIYADLADSNSAQFAQVFTSFLPWVKEHRYYEFASMMPEGKFVFNAENGERIVGLLSDWRESEKK